MLSGKSGGHLHAVTVLSAIRDGQHLLPAVRLAEDCRHRCILAPEDIPLAVFPVDHRRKPGQNAVLRLDGIPRL